jgi:ribonuclease PH
VLIIQIQSSGDGHAAAAATASSLAMTSLGIPLTGSSMSAGFTIGFLKGVMIASCRHL